MPPYRPSPRPREILRGLRELGALVAAGLRALVDLARGRLPASTGSAPVAKAPPAAKARKRAKAARPHRPVGPFPSHD